MLELEKLEFGETIRLDGKRYRVVRKWDGASIRVTSVDFRPELLTLHYGANGHPTTSLEKVFGLS